MKYGISFTNRFRDIIIKKATDSINECLHTIKEEVDRNTPEDTGTLLEGNKIELAQVSGTKIVGRVINRTPYALHVEYGVRGKIYHYHKPKGWVFYVGVGVRMYTKAHDTCLPKIISKIKNDLG